MPDTLLTIRQSVLNWLRGDYTASTDIPTLNEAINDALSKIWNKMIITQYERFMGPTSPLTFVAPIGAQRVTLTSIADPTVPLPLTTILGGALGTRTYQIQYTYVTESGSETNPSAIQSLTIPSLSIGAFGLPAPPSTPAFGWNLYSSGASNLASNIVLQNQNPLPLNIGFVEPFAGFQDYGSPNYDQLPPTANATGDNIAWIEHMEIQTSDTLFRAWNQMGIDASLMRGYAATLSSASEYQRYAWDLINGNIVEFRPILGSTFNPRYWPIVKVRRLAYDQAEMPYMNINGVREFIVSRAVADLKLGVDEYIANENWGKKAELAAMDVQMALLQENWKKDTRVAPHLLAS
jgi:hypothetical protein